MCIILNLYEVVSPIDHDKKCEAIENTENN